jgi:hypothetical protein
MAKVKGVAKPEGLVKPEKTEDIEKVLNTTMADGIVELVGGHASIVKGEAKEFLGIDSLSEAVKDFKIRKQQ